MGGSGSGGGFIARSVKSFSSNFRWPCPCFGDTLSFFNYFFNDGTKGLF